MSNHAKRVYPYYVESGPYRDAKDCGDWAPVRYDYRASCVWEIPLTLDRQDSFPGRWDSIPNQPVAAAPPPPPLSPQIQRMSVTESSSPSR